MEGRRHRGPYSINPYNSGNADLHSHNYRSPKDSYTSPKAMVLACERNKITYLALTNHGTIEGAEELQQVAEESGSKLVVIPGEEILTIDTNSRDKEIEIIALFISETVPNEKLSIKEVIEAVAEQDGILYIPHPTDKKRHGAEEKGTRITLELAREESVPCIVEVFNARSGPELDAESEALFEKMRQEGFDAYIGVGSDAHFPGEIGRVKYWLKHWKTKEEFLRSLKLARRDARCFQGDDSRLTTLMYRIARRIPILRQQLSTAF